MGNFGKVAKIVSCACGVERGNAIDGNGNALEGMQRRADFARKFQMIEDYKRRQREQAQSLIAPMPVELLAMGGSVNRFDNGGGRTILAKDLDEDWVKKNAGMRVRTPKGKVTTLGKMYRDYTETPLLWDDLPASYRNNHTNTADMRLRESIADANDLTAQAMQKRAADRWVSGLNMTEINKREQWQNLVDALAYSAAGAMSVYGLPALWYAFGANPIATGAALLGSTGIGLGTNWAVDKRTGKNVGQWLNKGLGIDEDSLAGYMLDPSYMASANRFARMNAQSFIENSGKHCYSFDNKVLPTLKGIPKQYFNEIKSKITGVPVDIKAGPGGTRNEAFARSLGIPIKDEVYIPNTDGTVSVSATEYKRNKALQDKMVEYMGDTDVNGNPTAIERRQSMGANKHWWEDGAKPDEDIVMDFTDWDYFTRDHNGGHTNTKIWNTTTGKPLIRHRGKDGTFDYTKDNYMLLRNKDNIRATTIDDFDLHFLQPCGYYINRLPKPLKKIGRYVIDNIEGIKILGGTPLTLNQEGKVRIDMGGTSNTPFDIHWEFPEFQTDIPTNLKYVHGIPSRYELGSRATQFLNGPRSFELRGLTRGDDDE